jgi:hypothetical protein
MNLTEIKRTLDNKKGELDCSDDEVNAIIEILDAIRGAERSRKALIREIIEKNQTA